MSIKFKKVCLLLVDIFLLFIIFLLIFYLFFEKKYDNKIYPGVFLSDLDLSGLTAGEAKVFVDKKIEQFDSRGVKIISDEGEILWRRDVFSFDPDLASQTIFFDVSKTMDKAFLLGRSGNLFSNFAFKLKSLFKEELVYLSLYVEQDKIKSFLNESFVELKNPPQNAKILSNRLEFIYKDLSDEKNNNSVNDEVSIDDEIKFFIIPETYGKEANYDKFFKDLGDRLSSLKNDNIYLDLVESSPLIKKEEIIGFDFYAYELLELAPFDLKYIEDDVEKKITVDKEVFSTWLKVDKQNLEGEGSEIFFSLNYDEVVKFFEKNIVEETDKDPVKPQFEFENGRVSLFFAGQDGLKLNYEKSFKNILNSFLLKDFTNVLLEIEVDEIEKVGSINDLGIKELIGSGHSNFAGSSANRRHNIKVGSEKLNGIIIKSGEELSVVKALGPTTKEAGYLTELVIKGDKTIPEYGGGLCQVSTTMFRAALAAGLPVTERRNHSYRVSYYEPAGTDATIYSPRPDLKFKNDTNNNILIQARFEGFNDMYFDFWGTSDGRVATTTYPIIYNIVRPGPTQIIETTNLPVGEKKCTERAHFGADTYFDYTVVYNFGLEEEEEVKTRFHSKYVPWREVCLLGVEKIEDEKPLEEDSGDEVVIAEQ